MQDLDETRNPHVEFLARFCGEHCRDWNYHCVTCHRNAELSCLGEIHDILPTIVQTGKVIEQFAQLLEMFGRSPMAAMMGGAPPGKLPPGFGSSK